MDSGNGNEKVVPNDEPEVGSNTVGAVGGRRRIHIQPTRSSNRLRNQGLPYEVFDNELLRKKILGYAVFSGEKDNGIRNNSRSLRLVGKSWNETVIKLLHKWQEPLIDVYSHPVRRLKSFCSVFASSPMINGCIPPFSLRIIYYEGTILKEVCNLLTKCGSGLLQLNVSLGTKVKYKRQFPNCSLPRLGKLNILITLDRQVAKVGTTVGQDGGMAVASALTKALCEAATNADVTLTLAFGPPLLIVDEGGQIAHRSILGSISIPSSITNLTLRGELRNADVEVLVRKSLPNLTSLSLFVTNGLFENGPFFRILDVYRVSLKKLFIAHFGYGATHPILIRLPVMETLEELFINSNGLELEPGQVSLETFFPKLRTLQFQNVTYAILQKWTERSRFTSVTTFDFSANNLSLNMEIMQSVNFAFPNLRKLSLTFSGGQPSALKYLFQEMTQLTELTLVSRRIWPEIDPNFWDAVLTGVSIETVAESRADPDFWERFDMNEEEALDSIKNLQELTNLTLHGYYLFNQRPPLITDVTFKRALFKMPKLKKLYLNGTFVASAEMSEEWRRGGRFLEYKNKNTWEAL